MSEELLDEAIIEENNYKYAGFWTRFGAAFIDGLILLPLGLAYFLILVDINYVIITLFTTLLSSLYKPLLEAKYGATLGKMAVGVKVLNTDGSPIGTAEAFKRFALPWGYAGVISLISAFSIHELAAGVTGDIGFVEFSQLSQQQDGLMSVLSGISSVLYLVFGLSIAFDKPMKRGLHDKIGGTMVVFK